MKRNSLKRLSLIVLGGIATCPFQPLQSGEVYPDWINDYSGNESGTLLLWKFDSPSVNIDSAGNGYTLSFASIGTETGVEGRFGQAFLSQGPRSTTNDSYAHSVSSVTAFNGPAMTVEFWYKPLSDNPSAGSNLTYFFDKKYSDHTGIQLALSNLTGAQNALRFAVGNGTGTSTLQSPTLTWNPEYWYHIAVTYENTDGDGNLKIYRDGALLAEKTESGFGDLSAGIRYYRLGNRLGSSYGSVPGYYDNFRVSDLARRFVEQPAVFPIGGYSGNPINDQAAGFTWSGPTYGLQPERLAQSESINQPFLYRVGVHIDFLGTPPSELEAELDFDEIADEITAQVLEVVDSPVIVAWYLTPEELRYWRSLEMQYLEVASNAIRAADPKGRPVWMYEPNHRISTSLQETFPFQDMGTKGVYTNYVNRKYERAWVPYTISQIFDATDNVNPSMPVLATLEMFQEPAPAEVALIPAWVRHDSYASLLSGVDGIIIYSLANRAGFTSHPIYYNAYSQVAEELNGPRHLGAVFLQGNSIPIPSYTVVSGDDEYLLEAGSGGVTTSVIMDSLQTTALEWWDNKYFFIVNSTPDTIVIELDEAGYWKPLLAGQPQLDEDRKTLTLEAWAVAAFTEEAEAYTAWTADYTGDEPDTLLLWKFDSANPAADSSGNGYSLSLASSGATNTSAGRFGNAFESLAPFSTSNDSFAQSASSATALHGSSFSVEFWYSPGSSTPTNGANLGYFFDKKYSDLSGIQLTLSNLSGQSNALRFTVGNGASNITLGSPSLSWTANEWYHIALTYENIGGDGFLRIYRDGEILAQQVAYGFGDVEIGTRFYRLGNRLGSNFGSVPGKYDNFRVSSRAINFAPSP